MQKYLIAAVLVVSLVAPVMAEEAFYVIFDNTLKGCKLVDSIVSKAQRPPYQFGGGLPHPMELMRNEEQDKGRAEQIMYLMQCRPPPTRCIKHMPP